MTPKSSDQWSVIRKKEKIIQCPLSSLIKAIHIRRTPPEGDQFDFVTYEISQLERIHEINDTVEDRIEDARIAPHHGNTQGGPLMQVLVLNFGHCNIEPVAALLEKALYDLPLVLQGLISVKSKLNARNTDRH
jgi:hypothetical protein